VVRTHAEEFCRRDLTAKRLCIPLTEINLEDGLVEESNDRPDPEFDDERRRYYRLTDFGYRVAKAESERLAALLKTARAKKLLSRLGDA
jgi:hypothetical protein